MTRSRLLPLAALVLLLLALALPAFAAPCPRASSAGVTGAVPATLVKVIDGDTIDVLINDKVERVRKPSIRVTGTGQLRSVENSGYRDSLKHHPGRAPG